MNKTKAQRCAILLCTLFFVGITSPFLKPTASAQNIVTIFGQEKIEKTDEGQVFHTFRDGLLLPGNANQGTLFNGQDMVAWLYATGQFTTPQAGDSLTWAYPNAQPPFAPPGGRMPRFTPLPQWKWTAIQADSLGRFQSPFMRSAYLYMAYDSPVKQTVLLETTGGTRVYVNGYPHEGDHYDFGYTLIPITLEKGRNEIIHTPGRFGRISAKLVKTDKPVMFTQRDMTVPDLIFGEKENKWAAIRVINTTEKIIKGMHIRATLAGGQTYTTPAHDIMPLAVRKLAYQLPPVAENNTEERTTVTLELFDRNGKIIDRTQIELRQVTSSVHHERTFLSGIDGSVQYYSVTPAIRTTADEQKAMVLSVHGAGVEARNQARAYKRKDWTDVIAATNRRPYGFNWEEWGRIDALEVLEEAQRVFQPDRSRIYLTGHSMGGHGTWYLGTTYPDRFAAIAPCAGYPDISTYGMGRTDQMHKDNPFYEAFARGANAGRTLSLIQNLKQSGVYVFHGDADNVVPPAQARMMREELGKFHSDFCYYEYPGGEHWFGDISVDWKPIFEFFSRHSIPQYKEVKEIDFHTASPAVSATDYWVTVEQQVIPYDFSNIKARKENDTIRIDRIGNIALFVLDLPALTFASAEAIVAIEGEQFSFPANRKAHLSLTDGKWEITEGIDTRQKYSARYGGFKQAFNNNVVFVYATQGNKSENEWYRNKARFDAETFYYRGNGSIDVIPDTEYALAKYADRNVIIYGNKENNRAWPLLLKDCPVQVGRKQITAGDKTFTGADLATYFIYPHPQSPTASVGVVAGTGEAGRMATSSNNYISGITGFPDLMIFRADMLRDGLEKVEVAGYFTNNWEL